MRALIAGLILTAGMAGSAGAEPVREAVTIANLFRAENGLGPLKVSTVLEAVAEGHGRDMAQNGFYSHTGSDGSSIGKRAKRQKYRFCLIAENIAKGQRSTGEVMQDWMTSPGHRKNILQRKARDIGVIRQADNIWVMVLGTRRGDC